MMECKHEDAVKWNPYNQVVQCHRCGLMFVPATDADYVGLNKRIDSGEYKRREFFGVSDIEVIRDLVNGK